MNRAVPPNGGMGRLMLKSTAHTRLQDGTCTAPMLGAGWLPGHPDQDRASTVSSVARLHQVFDRLFKKQALRNRLFKKQHSRPEGRQTVWHSVVHMRRRLAALRYSRAREETEQSVELSR